MNANMLLAEIKLRGLSTNEFLLQIQMPKATWYKKIHGISEFTRAEMKRIISVLNLSEDKIMRIFFASKVS